MRKRVIAVLATTAFVFHFATITSFAAPENIGRADRVQNAVTGHLGGKSSKISVGSSVYRNQRIRTRSNSMAQFRFKDNTRLAVGANSSIVLDNAVFSGGAKEKLILKAARGAFRFASGKLRKRAYKLVTPSSTLGIRGTLFELFVGRRGETILTLLNGSLTACTARGACRTIKDPCDCLRIDPSGNITSSTGLNRAVLRGTSARRAAPFLFHQSNLPRSMRAPGWLIAKCTGGAGSDTDGPDSGNSGADPVGNGGSDPVGNGGNDVNGGGDYG